MQKVYQKRPEVLHCRDFEGRLFVAAYQKQIVSRAVAQVLSPERLRCGALSASRQLSSAIVQADPRINAACSPRVNAPNDQLAPDGRLLGTAAPILDTRGQER